MGGFAADGCSSLLEGIRNYDVGRAVPFLAYIKNKLNFDIYNLCRKERNLAARRIYTDKADAEPLTGWRMNQLTSKRTF